MWTWFKAMWKTDQYDVFFEYSEHMGGKVIAQDKLYHFIICYLGWEILIKFFDYTTVALIAIGFSLFWELVVDYFHKSKSASWKDIIANGIGFICAILI